MMKFNFLLSSTSIFINNYRYMYMYYTNQVKMEATIF